MSKVSVKARLPRNSKSIGTAALVVMLALGIAAYGLSAGTVNIDIGLTEARQNTSTNTATCSSPALNLSEYNDTARNTSRYYRNGTCWVPDNSSETNQSDSVNETK